MSIAPFRGFVNVLLEVTYALAPLYVIFLFFQIFYLKLSRRKVLDITIGFVLSFIGLAIFLQGVHFGFLPVGARMGEILGSLSYKWIMIPLGFLLGFLPFMPNRR